MTQGECDDGTARRSVNRRFVQSHSGTDYVSRTAIQLGRRLRHSTLCGAVARC